MRCAAAWPRKPPSVQGILRNAGFEGQLGYANVVRRQHLGNDGCFEFFRILSHVTCIPLAPLLFKQNPSWAGDIYPDTGGWLFTKVVLKEPHPIDLTSGTMRRAMEAACSAMARRTCGVPCPPQTHERVRSSRSTSKSAPKGKSELPRNVATRSPQAISRYQRSNHRPRARSQRDAPGSVQAWIPECRSWSSRRCYTQAACGDSD